MNVNFSERLSSVLREKGLSGADLGRQTGLSKGAISHYLKQNRFPGSEELHRISKFLGVSMNWLMGDDDDISAARVDNCKQSQPRESLGSRAVPDIPLSQSLIDRLDARADDLGLDRLSVLTMTVKKGLDKLDRLDQDSATDLARALHRKVAEEEGIYGEDTTEKNTG